MCTVTFTYYQCITHGFASTFQQFHSIIQNQVHRYCLQTDKIGGVWDLRIVKPCSVSFNAQGELCRCSMWPLSISERILAETGRQYVRCRKQTCMAVSNQ